MTPSELDGNFLYLEELVNETIGGPGMTGPQGDTGAPGQTGPQGDTGAPGQTGPQGDAGAPGPQGDTGAPGPQGDAGTPGQTGPQGDAGAPGPQGDTGAPGPQGDTGAPGPQGDTGAPGQTGPQGDTGITTTQPPSSSLGTIGDQAGMLAFDETNIYYCIQNFGGTTYNAFVVTGGLGNPQGILADIGMNPAPESGWNIYYDSNIGVIDQTVPQGNNYVILWNPPINIPSDVTISYGPIPVNDIWVKQAWGVTGSW